MKVDFENKEVLIGADEEVTTTDLINFVQKHVLSNFKIVKEPITYWRDRTSSTYYIGNDPYYKPMYSPITYTT